MTEFKLPELGENIQEAEVIRLLVSEGDEIQAEQAVMEVESDKAATTLPCPFAGKVKEIHVTEGEMIHVGQSLLAVEETQATEEPPPEKEAPAGEEQQESEPAPDSQEQQPPVDSASGEKDGEAQREKQPTRKEPPVPAGPATHKTARELSVDLEEVEGTGPDGRIVPEDVKAVAQQRQGTSQGVTEPPLPDFGRWGNVRRQRLSKLARTAAERLSLSWQIVPHVTQNAFADITRLEAARKRYDRKRSTEQPKITLTAVVVKAVVVTLKDFPHLNSSLDSASGELVLKDYYHMGVAVDTEEGLLVPVLRDADQKSVTVLARELEELAERSRSRDLKAEEMEGGTFTVTNVGGIAGSTFTPIIHHPEVAILGLGRAQWQCEPGAARRNSRRRRRNNRLELPLSLSYDHRVVNGAEGARFVRKVMDLLADPFFLMTEI